MSYKNNEIATDHATHSRSPCVSKPFHSQLLSPSSVLPHLLHNDSMSVFMMDESINFLFICTKVQKIGSLGSHLHS